MDLEMSWQTYSEKVRNVEKNTVLMGVVITKRL